MRYENKYAKKYCIKRKCGKKSYARSLCKSHYENLKRHGRSMNLEELKIKRRTVNKFVVHESHIEIHIKDKIIKFDKDLRLFSLIRRKKWMVGVNGYAVSGQIYLHDFIFKKDEGMYVDHINRDKLDNRVSNLRSVTPQENTWNYTPKGKSGHRNVHWDGKNNSWRVQINRKNYGRYKILEDAVQSAKKIREELYGSNFA